MKGGLALAFAGTLLIITKGQLQALTALQFSLGNLWSLLAAIAFAWFSIRVRDWTRTIAPLALTVVTAWSGLIVVMLPVYAGLDRSAADHGWSGTPPIPASRSRRLPISGSGPTMLGNLFYLYGVAATWARRAPRHSSISVRCFPLRSRSAGSANNWPGIISPELQRYLSG